MGAQNFLGAAPRMAARHHHQGLGIERVPGKVCRQAFQVFDDQRAIQLAGFHLLRQLTRFAGNELDVQPLVHLLEPRHRMCQRSHHRHHRANRHGPGELRLGLVADAHGVVQRQEVLGLRQQRATMRVEGDSAPRPVKQVTAQFVFQRTHLQAHRGLRQRNALGGGGKRAMACHGNKGAEEADGTHGRARRILKFFLSSIQ